ncbi:cell division protein FtsQ/DivIB [Albibacterium indicum]|uniref:cell division protein FtsQ/DivIB n=1 Tax=Albibacterium indicum TaxID=2292082 RepID=UPI001300823C|nr:cell division protein FtsQ [Pedobacter indicus]
MLKRLKHIRWKRVLLLFVWAASLSGLFVLMSFISVKSNDLACRDLVVIIPGEQSFVARQDIDQLILEKHGEVVGRTLKSLPIHDIEADLRSIPFIENALVNMDMNGKVEIRINQREAVLRVINRKGEDFYLDKNLIKIPLSNHYAPNVLVANGMINEDYGSGLDSVQSDVLKGLYAIAEYVEQDSIWEAQIEQLYVNRDGEIEMVPRVGSHQIILGNADSLDLKFEKLRLFYKHIVPKVGWDTYKGVNLSFANQIVCIRKEENLINNNSINQ